MGLLLAHVMFSRFDTVCTILKNVKKHPCRSVTFSSVAG